MTALLSLLVGNALVIGRARALVSCLLLCAVAITAGCGGGDTPGTTVPKDRLPPQTATAIKSLYERQLNELGMTLTDRGGLIDVSGGGYYSSTKGTHLALYVEPTDDHTDQQYIDGILDVAKVFATDIFDRWAGLESFDVCQEPPQTVDPRPEPVATTQIELTRAQSGQINWDTATTQDLVAGSFAQPPKLKLVVSAQIYDNTTYRRMLEATRKH